ncbi:MAG: hypothetical protein WCO97_08265 [bacterium]
MELGDRNKKFADAVNEFMKQLLVNGLIPGRNEEFTEAIQIAIHNPQYVRGIPIGALFFATRTEHGDA